LKKRITIMLDEELFRKIRKKQARLVKKRVGYVSFSAVLNDYLTNALIRTPQTIILKKSKKSKNS